MHKLSTISLHSEINPINTDETYTLYKSPVPGLGTFTNVSCNKWVFCISHFLHGSHFIKQNASYNSYETASVKGYQDSEVLINTERLLNVTHNILKVGDQQLLLWDTHFFGLQLLQVSLEEVCKICLTRKGKKDKCIPHKQQYIFCTTCSSQRKIVCLPARHVLNSMWFLQKEGGKCGHGERETER